MDLRRTDGRTDGRVRWKAEGSCSAGSGEEKKKLFTCKRELCVHAEGTRGAHLDVHFARARARARLCPRVREGSSAVRNESAPLRAPLSTAPLCPGRRRCGPAPT